MYPRDSRPRVSLPGPRRAVFRAPRSSPRPPPADPYDAGRERPEADVGK